MLPGYGFVVESDDNEYQVPGYGFLQATQNAASTVSADGSAAGTSTATATGASIAAATGSAAGSSSVSGVGAATSAATGSAAGTSTASAVGASTAGAAGSSAGTSTASGVGAAIAAFAGSASGSSSVSGVGAATAASVGSAAGTSTASGVGESFSSGGWIFRRRPYYVEADGQRFFFATQAEAVAALKTLRREEQAKPKKQRKTWRLVRSPQVPAESVETLLVVEPPVVEGDDEEDIEMLLMAA